MVQLPYWLSGSSSAIDISHHTPCINANQFSCVVLNPLAITCPFACTSFICTFHKSKLILPSNFSMSNFVALEYDIAVAQYYPSSAPSQYHT
ncbi:hypothetical protein MTR_1g115310 [Medicago truncatula]|uniref:Uncharacterized protein n=1 Tax=Medicago truncatula TaxID=3880 RepID=A0A072VR49_MEDTR|nr:hypothetical protein MTR_1g115310 [Medicago truncatula]